MTARVVTGGDLTPEQRRVLRVEQILRRDGGSPGSALEGLAAIVEEELWRKVPSASGKPFLSFGAFVEAAPPFGLGYSTGQLTALLRLEHPHERKSAEVRDRMVAMREHVIRLTRDEVPALVEPGAVGRGRNRDGATKSIPASTADYFTARLKRDDPALAEQVVAGRMSANAAARQKGWKKPRILLTSPESVARALRANFSADDLARLIRLLLEEP